MIEQEGAGELHDSPEKNGEGTSKSWVGGGKPEKTYKKSAGGEAAKNQRDQLKIKMKTIMPVQKKGGDTLFTNRKRRRGGSR